MNYETNIYPDGTQAKGVKLADRTTKGQPVQKSNVIELPHHLFLPSTSKSLDFRRLVEVGPATVKAVLLQFKAPKSQVWHFTHYAIFSDAENESDVEFLPLVDNNRVFQYHGNPMNNFRISLGLTADLSNNALIECNLTLYPEQEFKMLITNNAAVNTFMGARLKGWVDSGQKNMSNNFGG